MLSKLLSLCFTSPWYYVIAFAAALGVAACTGYQIADLRWELKWAEQAAAMSDGHRAHLEEVRNYEHAALARAEDTSRTLRRSLAEVQARYDALVSDLDRHDADGERVPERRPDAAAGAHSVPAASAASVRACKPCNCGRSRPYVEADKALAMARERDELAERLNAFIDFYNALREKHK